MCLQLMEGHHCSLKTDLGQKFGKKLESRFFQAKMSAAVFRRVETKDCTLVSKPYPNFMKLMCKFNNYGVASYASHHFRFPTLSAVCDITGLFQSSFSWPCSGQSAFTPRTINLRIYRSPLQTSSCYPPPPHNSLWLHSSLHLCLHQQRL